MKTRKVWLFSAHLLPLLARFCAVPHATLLTVNTFSMGLTGAGATIFLLSHLFLPYRLARAAYSELVHMEVLFFGKTSLKKSCRWERLDSAHVYFRFPLIHMLHLLVFQVFELYRLLAVGFSLWNQFAIPVLFSVFWFVLFIVQLCSDTMNGNGSLGHQGIMFFLLTRCCEMWKISLVCGSLFQTTYLLFFPFNVQCLWVLCHSILSFGPDLCGVLSCSRTA